MKARKHPVTSRMERMEPRQLLSGTVDELVPDELIPGEDDAPMDEGVSLQPLVATQASAASLITLAAAVGSPRQMEYLDRGVVAIRSSSAGIGDAYVGWRLLGTDPADVSFNLYRSTSGAAAIKLNASALTQTTDFVDAGVDFTLSNAYFVRPVLGGLEQPPSEVFTLAANTPAGQHLDIPLTPPTATPLPNGSSSYTYAANDASVGDVDGDGQYEIILKWDPSNAQDNSNAGYTGPVYIDAYKLNGTRLWRINLGQNVRAGAHYTQFQVYDLDGDGKAEIAMKTAPGSIDGQGNAILLPGDNVTDDYRNSAGYIITGPEYLTIFNGLTGAAMVTVPLLPDRVDVAQWGDTYGNRVDRFLSGVAYLDGQRPSLIMARGYYGPQGGQTMARNEVAAYNWRDGQLSHLWTFKAALGINDNINSNYISQGAHSLNIADVDGDGKDEIVYGACAIDDNGSGLYSTGLGHGDALFTTDMDPSQPGLETFQVHESPGSYGAYGGDLRSGTGQLLLAISGTNGDVGRGNAFDIDPRYLGFELWNSRDSGIYNVDGTRIQTKPGNIFTNMGIWWNADPMRELQDGTTISRWNINPTTGVGGRANLVFAPAGLASNNGTKATPTLIADILGDWREEIIWRQSNNLALQIWTTTIPATNRIYTLMHDTHYRESVAWQNVAYNQPTSTSFYLGAADASGAFPAIPAANIYLVGGPEAPSGLTVTDATINQVDLAWNPVAGASAYNVKRSEVSGGPYTTIAENITFTNLTDLAVFGGSTYHYVVSAVGPGGQGADSAEVIATTPEIVVYQAGPSSGGFIQFDKVYADAGGPTRVRFRYALEGPGDLAGSLIVNGIAQPITFVPTGGLTDWQTLELSLNLNPLTQNILRLESTGQSLPSIDELQVNVLPDTTAPTTLSSSFHYETAPNKLIFQFSEDVSDSLGLRDLVITTGSGWCRVIVKPKTMSYDPATNTATFALHTPLRDGEYTASFIAGGVTDTFGNPLSPGEPYEFFVLAGDANRDGEVDWDDLEILRDNWRKRNAVFSDGDFNYDGKVNGPDIAILVRNWSDRPDHKDKYKHKFGHGRDRRDRVIDCLRD